MIKVAVTVIVCLTIYFASNVYAGYDEDVVTVNKGMPKQVQQFNKRQIECNHWAGEEPYDKERIKEITTAIAHLKCKTLVIDEKKLLKKYQSRLDVIESINKAKEFF